MDKPEIDPKTGLWKEPQPYEHSKYYYDYTRNDPDRENPFENDGLDYEIDLYNSAFSLVRNPFCLPFDMGYNNEHTDRLYLTYNQQKNSCNRLHSQDHHFHKVVVLSTTLSLGLFLVYP